MDFLGNISRMGDCGSKLEYPKCVTSCDDMVLYLTGLKLQIPNVIVCDITQLDITSLIRSLQNEEQVNRKRQ